VRWNEYGRNVYGLHFLNEYGRNVYGLHFLGSAVRWIKTANKRKNKWGSLGTKNVLEWSVTRGRRTGANFLGSRPRKRGPVQASRRITGGQENHGSIIRQILASRWFSVATCCRRVRRSDGVWGARIGPP
jgi:hypothetical protein